MKKIVVTMKKFQNFKNIFEKNFVYICLHKKIRKNPEEKNKKYYYEVTLLFKIINKLF